MGIPILQVDAFTDQPFRGNPAAVCILPEPQSDQWMQDLAAEMNLSETAFLWRQKDEFGLRWFTPVTEVNLCGHATLASAHVLWEQGYLASGTQARFKTLSGLLTAERNGDWIELDFPLGKVEQANLPPEIAQALGVEPKFTGFDGADYLVEVESAETVRRLAPDMNLLKKAPTRGVIITSRSDSKDYDFISRFFAPRAGIDEDPVTGSAHCSLGPFWSERIGKNELVAYQASRRGGVVRVRLQNDRAILGGKAVTVFHGELK